MLPLLRLLRDGRQHLFRECTEELADQFGLSPEERRQLVPSGGLPVFHNRVGWARTYLKKAGLLSPPKRGTVQITDRAKQVLESRPGKIDCAFLMQFPEFRERRREEREHRPQSVETAGRLDPLEQIEEAYSEYRRNLGDGVLDLVRRVSPTFFERLVVNLPVEMGYGGTLKEAGQVIGGARDEGIDGIIKEDRLGLDVLYIQAKQWSGPVGRPELQKLVGALHGRRARKGGFITTSSFTREARGFVSHIDPKVVLIDGEALVELMIGYNVGTTPKASYEIKAVDRDFLRKRARGKEGASRLLRQQGPVLAAK